MQHARTLYYIFQSHQTSLLSKPINPTLELSSYLLILRKLFDLGYVAKTSTVPDHCRQYALSDPCDEDFQLACDHTHQDTCHRCEELTAVLHEIDEGIQRMSSNNNSEDTREKLFFVSDQSKQNILAWKAHIY